MELRKAGVVDDKQIYELVLEGQVVFAGTRGQCKRYIEVRLDKEGGGGAESKKDFNSIRKDRFGSPNIVRARPRSRRRRKH
jgi:hypothetical protein